MGCVSTWEKGCSASAHHDLFQQKEAGAAFELEIDKKTKPEDWDVDTHAFLLGTTPLHTAVLGGHSEVVELLLDKKCAPPLKALDLLHRAVCTGAARIGGVRIGHAKVIELLATRGEAIGMDVNAGRSKCELVATKLEML